MMIPRIVTLAIASAIFTLPEHAAAQAVEGYSLTAAMAALPDSLVEVSHGGRFRITVLRVARDSLERRLIDTAERLIPHHDTIARAASAVGGGGHNQAIAEASRLDGERWWWHERDRILLPFALTGAAAEYYIARVRDFSTQPNPFARYNPGVPHTASVVYTARVVHTGVEASPLQVELIVGFWFYCGLRCALRFAHSRLVEFDATGRPIRVVGDRPPSAVES